MNTEQNNPGTLILLPFLLMLGGQMSVTLPEPLPDCWTERGGEYVGRDAGGVPEFEYWERRICDE